MDATRSGSLSIRAIEATTFLRNALPASLSMPHVAIICGSGLGGLQHAIQPSPRHEFRYADIPHFPRSSVQGHEGKMVFGVMTAGDRGMPVVLLVGRAHFYEGHSMELVTFATRVCASLEVQTMIMTNAAGGLSPLHNVGDIVLISDHINLAGLVGNHPLRGPNEDDLGVRFPPLSDAYDLDLRRRAHIAWAEIQQGSPTMPKMTLHEGVYAFVGGPSYETRAECRMLRLLGADIVGMSTVPEIIAARHAGMRVLALSLVTNNAVLEPVIRGDDPAVAGMGQTELMDFLGKGKANHEEVLEAGKSAAETMQALVKQIFAGLFVSARVTS